MVKGFFISKTFLVLTWNYKIKPTMRLSLTFVSSIFRCNIWNNIVQSWKAMLNGQEFPYMQSVEKQFNNNISFVIAVSSSILQFTLGNIIIRTYGLSDDLMAKFFQLFNMATSSFNLIVVISSVRRQTFVFLQQGLNRNLYHFRDNIIWNHWNIKLWKGQCMEC